jgi:hypothetical protein
MQIPSIERYAAFIPGPLGRVGGRVVQGVISMKIRTLLFAVIAFVVLAGSVVPANAAGRHHHKGHRHHHK